MILVNIAELAWSSERRRNAAMFVELLRSGVPFSGGVYVDPPQFTGRATRLGGRARAAAASLRIVELGELGDGIWRYSPSFFMPFYGRRPIFRGQVALFRAVLMRFLGVRPYCLWINNIEAGAHALATALAPTARSVVVDLSDDWTTFRDPDPAARDERVRSACRMANALIAVNEHVLAKFPHQNGRVFHNGTDFANFQRRDPGFKLDGIVPRAPGGKVVGFVGGLNVGRLDETLLFRLIDALPGTTFVFVGYSNAPDLVAKLRALPNVRVHPPIAYRDLPNVIRTFDVGIVPHLVNEHTRGNDLLKVLDYLACGVPVVSTDCSNVRKYGAAVRVASGHEEFEAMVRGLLDGEGHDPEPGLAAARAASWERTVPALGTWLADGLR